MGDRRCIQCDRQTTENCLIRTELGEAFVCKECTDENKLGNEREQENFEYNTRNGGSAAAAAAAAISSATTATAQASSNATETSSAVTGKGGEAADPARKSRTTRFKSKVMLASKSVTQGKSRRNIFKKTTPSRTPTASATTTTADCMFYKGTYFQVGDIVSLVDDEDDIYYAQIRALLQDAFCEKSAVISWLIPTRSSPDPNEKFDPSTYIIGPDEELARKLSCMEFVMNAPSTYYHDRTNPYPPVDHLQEDHCLSNYCGYIWTNMIKD